MRIVKPSFLPIIFFSIPYGGWSKDTRHKKEGKQQAWVWAHPNFSVQNMKNTQWAIYTKLLKIRNFGNYELIDNQRNLGAGWTCWEWLLPSSQTESCWMEAKIKYVLVISLVIDPTLLNLEPNQMSVTHIFCGLHTAGTNLTKNPVSLCLELLQSGGGVIPIYPILYMYVTSKAKFVHCIDVIFCGIQPCWSDDWQVSTGGAEDQITTPFIPFMQVRYNTSS